MNKNIRNKKILLTVGAVILFAAYFCYVLSHGLSDGKTIKHYPVMTDSAIYTELHDGDSLKVNINPEESFSVKALSLVLVNLNNSSEGYLDVLIEGDEIIPISFKVYEKDLSVGVWNSVPADIMFEKGKDYALTFRAVNCEPYFMYVPKTGLALLPFIEETFLNDQEIDSVSIGLVEETSGIHIRGIYIFILVLLLIILGFLICLIWLDVEGTIKLIDDRGIIRFITKYGSDLFLLCVFLFICVSIYEASYKNGIFITADSAGYLREAVNLKAGNGFGYDALAGYRSWFANWPILYPLCIFIVMLITGKEAYIASKILSGILVFAIILVLRKRFKNKTYLYAIPLLNFGFIELSHYTWSEMPFILFLTLFGFKLGDIVGNSEDKNIRSPLDYILLSLYGLLIFLTRYFGIYVWAVVGVYVLLYAWSFLRSKDIGYLKQAIALSLSAIAGAFLSFGYMFMNKLMNGMASGVSRSEWWDDYRTLTKDLFDSLVVEVFNIFHIDLSLVIKQVNYPVKVIFLLAIIGLIVFFCKKNCELYSKEAVFILMAAVYYVMFTIIRYFSSMDTFYFRFFEPATFLLTIGLLGITYNRLAEADKEKKSVLLKSVKYGVTIILLLLITKSVVETMGNGLMGTELDYYTICKAEWDKQYTEVKDHSVVIFSDLDFRSEYYRPDVVNGEITTEDTVDDIKNRYYGSSYAVIQKEYAEAMVECGEYKDDVTKLLADGISDNPSALKYISIKIN